MTFFSGNAGERLLVAISDVQDVVNLFNIMQGEVRWNRMLVGRFRALFTTKGGKSAII